MNAPRLALAIRHVHFEDCGTLAGVLRERGFETRYVEAGREGLRDVDVTTPDLVIGLGGPVSVYEAHRYPWITDELRLFERRLATRRPVLGICLGAQMLAKVLGARVFPQPEGARLGTLDADAGGRDFSRRPSRPGQYFDVALARRHLRPAA